MYEYEVKAITPKLYSINIKVSESNKIVEVRVRLMRVDGGYRYFLTRTTDPILFRVHNVTENVEVFDAVREVWEGGNRCIERMSDLFNTYINKTSNWFENE